MLLIYCWFFVFVVRDILIHVTNFSFGVSRSLRRNGNWTLCYENVTFAGLFSPFLLCLSLTAFATYIFAKTLRQLRTKEAWLGEWYSPEFRKKNLWHKFDGLGIYNSRFSALFESHDAINHILFQVIGHISSMAYIYAPNNATWCLFTAKAVL